MKRLKGFIFLYREMLDWRWYKDCAVKSVYIHILLSAAFKKSEWHDITIEPGQLVTSIGNIAKETGLSVMSVRTALKKLKSTGEITCTATSKYTLITVEKWGKFQKIKNSATSTLTNEQQTSNKQITNKQQHRNNVNNDNNADNVIRAKTSYDMDEFHKRAEQLPVYVSRNQKSE